MQGNLPRQLLGFYLAAVKGQHHFLSPVSQTRLHCRPMTGFTDGDIHDRRQLLHFVHVCCCSHDMQLDLYN